MSDLHIYMIGVGIQQLFILVFLGYAIGFHRVVLQEQALGGVARAKIMTLLYTLYASIALITVSNGASSRCRMVTLMLDHVRRALYSASANIRKALTARYRIMRPINTVWTRCRCCSRLCSSMSLILEGL